jgi:hypothetical protein
MLNMYIIMMMLRRRRKMGRNKVGNWNKNIIIMGV